MATLEQLQQGLVKADAAGAKEDAQAFADAIREHPTFRQNAKESLESGKYKMGENYETLSKDEQRANMSKQIARSMGLKDDEVDVTQGMGQKGRFTLSFQPTEADKFKELEDRYGRENIEAIDIGGKTKLLYRDEQETGGKFRAVDEEGTSLADFFGDTAGHVAPVVGAIGAAVATGGASIPLMAGAAALGTFAASAGQDVAVRAASDEDIRIGEIAKRRGIEAAIGIPIDLATGGLAKGISSRIGKNIAGDLAGNLAKAEGVLQKSEALSQAGLRLTPDMRVGKEATEAASEIAGSRKGSKIAGQYQRLRDNIAQYKEAVTTGATDTGESFGKAAQRIAGDYKRLIDDVAKIDADAAKVLEESMGRRISRLAAKDRVNLHKMGQVWMKRMGKGKEATAAQSAKNFEDVGRMARERGVSVSNQEVRSAILGALNRFKVKENPQVNKILNDLDDAGTMDFQTMREYIETIQDAVPEAGALGGKTSAQVASVAADSLRTLRNKVAQRGGDDFAKAYDNANQFYTDQMLQYRRGVGQKGTATAKGGDTATPAQVMNDILSDPAKMQQALSAIDPADDVGRSTAVNELREAFLSKLGLDGTTDMTNGVNLSNADRTIVEELWGKRRLNSFDRLNRQVKQIKDADFSKATPEELEELFSAFSTNDVDRIAKKVAQRTAKQARAEKLAGNSIMDKIIKGQYDDTNVATFADVLVGGDSKKVKEVMNVLKQGPKEEVEAVRQEFVSQLFARFSNGAQLDSAGMGIWNPQAMQKALAGRDGKKLLENMKSVLGPKQTKEIIAANDVLAASSAIGKQATGSVKPRFILSPTSIAGYMVGDIMGGVKNRFMGWAYGTDSLVPLMKLMSKNVSPEQFEKNFARIIGPMLAAEKGIVAAAREGESSPEFKDASLRAAAEMGQGNE